MWEVIRDINVKSIDASHVKALDDEILNNNIPFTLEILNISNTNIKGDFLKSL